MTDEMAGTIWREMGGTMISEISTKSIDQHEGMRCIPISRAGIRAAKLKNNFVRKCPFRIAYFNIGLEVPRNSFL